MIPLIEKKGSPKTRGKEIINYFAPYVSIVDLTVPFQRHGIKTIFELIFEKNNSYFREFTHIFANTRKLAHEYNFYRLYQTFHQFCIKYDFQHTVQLRRGKRSGCMLSMLCIV